MLRHRLHLASLPSEFAKFSRSKLERKRIFSLARKNFGLTTGVEQAFSDETKFVEHVHVFWDLDNVKPKTPTRVEVQEKCINPLVFFGKSLGCAPSKRNSTFQISAFCATRTLDWCGDGTSNDVDLKKQEFRQRLPTIKEKGMDKERLDKPGADFQSGVDKKGILRCGVCGSTMNAKKGRSARDVLKRHMKIHSREVNKKKAHASRGKQNLKAKQRSMAVFKEAKDKLMQASVGVMMPIVTKGNSKKVSNKQRPSNGLRQVLKENGVKVVHCKQAPQAADKALIQAAGKFILKEREIPQRTSKRESESLGKGESVNFDLSSGLSEAKPIELKHNLDEENHESTTRGKKCLVLVSGDGDYTEVVKAAREKGLLVVLAWPSRQAGHSQGSFKLATKADGLYLLDTKEMLGLTENGKALEKMMTS